MSQLLIFGLIFLGMWFLLIAPNRKRQKAHQQMLSALKAGDRVLLASGILGKILRARDGLLTVEIADGVRVEVLRGYVQRRLLAGEFADGAKEKDSGEVKALDWETASEGGTGTDGGEKKPVRRGSRGRPAKK